MNNTPARLISFLLSIGFGAAMGVSVTQPAWAQSSETTQGTATAAPTAISPASTAETTAEEKAKLAQEEAAEKRRLAQAAAAEARRERERQCVIRPVMTDAEIAQCKDVWR